MICQNMQCTYTERQVIHNKFYYAYFKQRENLGFKGGGHKRKDKINMCYKDMNGLNRLRKEPSSCIY